MFFLLLSQPRPQPLDAALQIPCNTPPVALAVGHIPILDRSRKDHFDPSRVGDRPTPAAALIRPVYVRRNNGQAVPERKLTDAGLELAILAVRGPRALGEQDDVGAFLHLPAAV